MMVLVPVLAAAAILLAAALGLAAMVNAMPWSGEDESD
jgi:hypothetical protein